MAYLVPAMAAYPPVYLDNNATTSCDPRVVELMSLCLRQSWGNPSSSHRWGDEAASLLRKARRTVAQAFGFLPSEVVFTSGGTESDVLALRGVVLASSVPRHLVVSAVEHPAVLSTARHLAEEGACELTVVGVDGQGLVDPDAVEAALREHTCLVSVMTANNETGVIQPVAAIARRVRERGIPFHSDMIQAVGKMPLSAEAASADLVSISAHKFHGPKGAGALLVRKGIALRAIFDAGGQESGRRGGTENVATVAGLARALELALENFPATIERMDSLRDRLEEGLKDRLEGVEITSQEAARVVNTTHFTLDGVESGALLTLLEEAAIGASAGSACRTGVLRPSPVLTAQGIDPRRLHSALRFSSSRLTTAEEIDRVLEVLPPLARRLRRLQSFPGGVK